MQGLNCEEMLYKTIYITFFLSEYQTSALNGMLSLIAQLHVMLDKYYYPGGMLWRMLSLNLLSGQINICVVTNNTALWNSLSINTAHCSSSLLRLLMTSVALVCPHRDVRVSLSVVILCPRAPCLNFIHI